MATIYFMLSYNDLVNDTLTVRRSLAFAVRVISDDRLTSLAQTLLKDSDEFVRYPVVSTRYTGKNPALLQSLLADPSQHVRVAALTVTIARQPAILAGNVLTTVAADKSFHVRSVLAAGLPATAPADLWGRLIADASPTVRSSALMGYQAAFGNDSVGVLTTAIKSDPSPYVRGAAATAAGKLPSSLADPIFQIGAADSSPIVVYSVFEAFAGAPYANDWILSSISAYLSAPTIYLRSSAVDALTALPTPQPVSYIQQAYLNSFEPNPRKFKDIRQQLVDLIAASPDADASTAALTADLSDPYTQVTNDARAALTSRNVTSLPSSPATPLELSPYRENVVAAAGTSTARVALHTTKGDMVIELYADDAPIHVASFLGVVRSGVYDGLTWHRVVDNFVIQGLDPDGNGYGDDGFTLRAEINGRLFTRGAVGMPRSASFASGGCQVFIAHVPIPHLDGQYTVFGQVVSGLDVIDLIEVGDLVLSAKVVA
ncbi:hypothetical protein HK101_011977 [Irineochytrium annulatum]|nr:hypothetical protein HK101_011977 [Irineochytrium annulatum]